MKGECVEYIHSLENSARYETIFYKGQKVENETVGELLNRLLTQKGMSQRKLANLSGVDRGYINSLVKGKAGSITLRVAKQFASALNVPAEIFLKSEGSIRKETHEEILEKLRIATPLSVPVYNDFPVHAGGAMEPVDYVYVARPKGATKPSIEGYVVRGNCLEPFIYPGDTIIVDRDAQPDAGKIVAYMYGEHFHIGRLRKIGKDFWLEDNHHSHKTGECQVVGVVIYSIKKL